MTHSTQSSLPSPSVCQTRFSSSVLPVMVMRVPPPFSGGFFWILPNYRGKSEAEVSAESPGAEAEPAAGRPTSARFGGIWWPA